MPRRTDAISRRDLEALDFVARFGVVPREAVATRLGSARSVTIGREARLRRAGLIEVDAGIGGAEGRLLLATAAGLRLCGRPELRRARLRLAAVPHDSRVARLAAALERAGEKTVSERQLAAAERLSGERHHCARLATGGHHRADLLRLLSAGPPEAIEVELSAKGAARLDAILRAWARAVAEGRLARVLYRCPPSTRPLLERAVRRTHTAAEIAVEPL